MWKFIEWLNLKLARLIGAVSGIIFGFLCGVKMAKHGYNRDAASYVWNKIYDENDRLFREKYWLENLSMFKLYYLCFREIDLKTYKDICAEVTKGK